MAGKIFISYRREDEPAEARSIRDRLAQAFGDKAIFMDVDDLAPGAHFGRELDAALSECAAFIAIIGPRWREILKARSEHGPEDYVVAEISSALNRDVLVVPTLVRSAKLPPSKELPESISDLAFRQAHEIRHEKFSSDISELTKILRQKANVGGTNQNALRNPTYWAAALVLALLIVGVWYFLAHGPIPLNMRQSQVVVFTHDEGLTADVAEGLRSELASSGVILVISQHVDRRRPDAIYISEKAPVGLVRPIVNRVFADVTHIFPVDYSTKSSTEMRGVDIAVGLMSDFEYYSENAAEKPYQISPSQLSWLLEDGLDQAAFVERLKYIAPARKRSE